MGIKRITKPGPRGLRDDWEEIGKEELKIKKVPLRKVQRKRG